MHDTSVNGKVQEPTSGPRSQEVVERPKRRRFSVDEKRRIVREADACAPGTLGAFIRREGIYSSQLATWRKERDRGELDPGALRNRAARRHQEQSSQRRISELEREVRGLRRQLTRAESVLEIQKKVAGLLGVDLKSPHPTEND
jgi:transposase-like protein